ncbi:glycosyltransferase family A protein [Cobetia sp. AM6]|uniref:glycosyltransferase family A protein n=1 Tax=Cobetia sp. AM6 TaxID=2661553 RepID=UPI00129907B5|nr:glycosyltransferase family A protein [Cobetia sp. AM6]BBO56866.1 hypothetical protein CLAM6_21770 [Cobetia sp. AM6]
MKQAIIIVAFNRSFELNRLLESIANSKIVSEIDLVISIDHSASQDAIKDIAHDFEWIYGNKRVILHKQNLGLKKHVISCGDLGSEYDMFIMLEEDIVVSPFFLQYTKDAINFYKADDSICGVSLYSYMVKESDKQPLYPVIDGYDNFFMQFPSSWGQAWTSKHWFDFKDWLIHNDSETKIDGVTPEYILRWPSSSWKKQFARYMCHKDKYFVYPRVSLTTNCGAKGQNHSFVFDLFSTQLLLGHYEWRFLSFDTAHIRYDSRFELNVSDEYINKYLPYLRLEFNNGEHGSRKFFRKYPYSFLFYGRLAVLSFINDFKKSIVKIGKSLK